MQITLTGDELELRFPPDHEVLTRVRALPARRFDALAGTWRVPHTLENWEALRLLGFDVTGLPAPTSSGYQVTVLDGLLCVRTPYSPRNAALCRAIPDHHMWNADAKAWLCRAMPRTLTYLKQTFPTAGWDAAAGALYQRLVMLPAERTQQLRQERLATIDAEAEVIDYKFGGPAPFKHQRRAFLLSRDQPAYALLMEQGTGKSKVLVDTAVWLYTRGRIKQVLVIAPNSVKTNWVTDEIPIHTPDYAAYRAAYWGGGTREHRRQVDAVLDPTDLALRWLVVNVEAFSSMTPGRIAAERFMAQAPTLLIVDESSRIKTPGANRTRAIINLGKRAPYRRIASGTPITQGPLDAYAQFTFLDPTILGFSSFTVFARHFAIMGGWNNKVVIGYAHVDELLHLIEPWSYRVLRVDCLDLPPKIYQHQDVELSGEQRRLYDQMRDHMIAQLTETQQVTTTMILTQLLRLQQIAGGFLPSEEVRVGDNGVPMLVRGETIPIPGTNPKLAALLELAEDVQGKMIVWARFRAELDLIARALRQGYGEAAVVEFHGGVDDDARVRARTAFQDPSDPVRFFVGQTETGGMGLTLTQARTVVYFSNSFSLESRLQSEDRAHRIGQTASVTYVDLIARDTIDQKLIAALRSKKVLAATVTGDAWRNWI